MAEKKKEDQRRVVFRRIGGRIVPIAVGSAGAAIAADAAMTRRVYQTKRITIDRKKFAYSPITNTIDTGLKLKVDGKSAGRILFSGEPGDSGSISWLSVKKQFRGKGYSKILAKQAAVELKARGVKSISSHVVHERSSNLFKGKVRSTWWKEISEKGGISNLVQVDKKSALRSVERWRKERVTGKGQESLMAMLKSRFSPEKGAQKALKYSARPIFRDVSIPKSLRRQRAPFMTAGSKLRVIGGLALAATSAFHFFRPRGE